MKEGLKETIEAIKNSKSETEAMGIAMEIFGAKRLLKWSMPSSVEL